MRAWKAITWGLVFFLQHMELFAQERTRILFVLDASLSMRNEWKGGSKWSVATNSLLAIADSISKIKNVEMGLRVFGDMYPEPDKNCHDTRMLIPFDTNNVSKFRRKINELRPKGITPLVYTIEKAAADFGDKRTKNIMVVITDGEDACDRDPCAVTAALKKYNVIVRPFIVGMNLQTNMLGKMNCMGRLFNTNNHTEFTNAMNKVVFESIAKTTLQVNLNDMYGKPTETNVNMTLYDCESGEPKYQFYHTLNARGIPDTLSVSHTFTYNLQIHTLSPIWVDSVVLKQNTHTVVNVNAAQGYLNFVLQGTLSQVHATDRIKCLIRQTGESNTLNVQRINTKEKYLCGTYDLDVLTLPRMTVHDVKIEQSKTTDVLMPTPGILTINKTFEMYGAIFIVTKGTMQKIYELHLKDRQETLTLQPGKYRLVYRSKNSRTIHTSVDKEFEMVSGGSLSLNL